VADLAALAGGPLAGAVPAGAGRLTRPEFRAVAARALAPHLGGRFDPAGFGERHTHPKGPA
jgi:dethiobiotin synthetase